MKSIADRVNIPDPDRKEVSRRPPCAQKRDDSPASQTRSRKIGPVTQMLSNAKGVILNKRMCALAAPFSSINHFAVGRASKSIRHLSRGQPTGDGG
jgi:hypothetical protein